MPISHIASAIVALLAVLALIVAVGRVGKFLRGRLDRGGARSGARLGIGAAVTIDAGRRLVVLRCDEREFAVLLGPGGDTTLCELSPRSVPGTGPCA